MIEIEDNPAEVAAEWVVMAGVAVALYVLFGVNAVIALVALYVSLIIASNILLNVSDVR